MLSSIPKEDSFSRIDEDLSITLIEREPEARQNMSFALRQVILTLGRDCISHEFNYIAG